MDNLENRLVAADSCLNQYENTIKQLEFKITEVDNKLGLT